MIKNLYFIATDLNLQAKRKKEKAFEVEDQGPRKEVIQDKRQQIYNP